MRQLTQKEIDNRPDGTNFYSINQDGSVLFTLRDAGLEQPGHRQVPRKEFDISEYLELDPEHPCRQPHIFEEDSCLNIDGKVSNFHAIGIAKHFKLTSEDLK